MADKDIARIAKEIEETRRRLASMEADLAKRSADLDARSEEQEANAELEDVTAPNGDHHQYRKERISRGDPAKIKKFTRFGWNFDRNHVFHYKNGDVRIKFWRDTTDSRFSSWQQNEKNLKYLFWLRHGLDILLSTVKGLPDEDYFFETKRELQECQQAFRTYENEIRADIRRVEAIESNLDKALDADGAAPFKAKSETEAIAAKYLFTYDWEWEKPEFTFNVIKYSKTTKCVDVLCLSNKELALSNAETEMEKSKFNAKKQVKTMATLVGVLSALLMGIMVAIWYCAYLYVTDCANLPLIALGVDAGLGLFLLVPTILSSNTKKKMADEKYTKEKERIEHTIID